MIRRFKDGDIATSGRQFSEGRDETAQALTYRLKLFLGEYYLNVAEGTPWLQGILGKAPQDVAEINLKQRILTSARVAGISRFRFTTDRNQRKIDVSATVVDIDSAEAEIQINEELF